MQEDKQQPQMPPQPEPQPQPQPQSQPQPQEQPLSSQPPQSSGVSQDSKPQDIFPQEKKELFRREEVHTMQKDLSRLLEEEAQKERERIAKLKTEEEIKKERERIARLRKEEEERIFAVKEERLRMQAAWRMEEQKKKDAQAAQEQLLAQEQLKKPAPPKPTYKLPFPLPKKPSFIDKLLSRTVVIGLMVAFWGILITFWYWYFVARQKGQEAVPTPPPQEEALPPEEVSPEEIPPEEIPPEEISPPGEILPGEPPRPELSQSIIPVNQDALVEFSSDEELPRLFSESVQQYRGEDVFTRLIIRNTSANTLLSLADFFRIFQIRTPAGLLEKLSPDATFFVYSSVIANRFGFAAQIVNPEGFEEQIRSWESTMEKDTENLFALLGKKEPSQKTAFRQAVYKDAVFRYVSFPSINFGIVWSSLSLAEPGTQETKQYFFFTSSGESMMRIIDRLSEKLAR